jgi:hypothetical protein
MKTRTLLASAGLLFCQTLIPAQAQQRTARQPAKAPVASAKAKPAPARPAAAPKPQVAQAAPAPQREAAPVAQPQPERPAAQPAAPAQKSTPTVRSSARASVRSSSGHRKFLNAGIGLAAYTAGGFPIGASFEVEVKDNVSVGGFLDYARYGYSDYGYRWNYTFVYLGARASYHAGELLGVTNPKFDPYAGISLGYRASRYGNNDGYYGSYYNPYGSSVFFGAHLGARYLFSDKVGGFAEVGYGVAALKLGVTAIF